MLGALAVILVPASMGAVPECKRGTLQSYLDLGFDGCSIGGVVVFDFELIVIPLGSREIVPESITVSPSREDSRPQLQFRLDAKAGAGELVASAFNFGAQGTIGTSFLDGVGARLDGATAGGDGAVTMLNSVCPGEEFVLDMCFALSDFTRPPSAITFVAGGDASRSGGVRVAPGDQMGVTVEIVVDGGLAGAGALQSATVLLGAPARSDGQEGEDQDHRLARASGHGRVRRAGQ